MRRPGQMSPPVRLDVDRTKPLGASFRQEEFLRGQTLLKNPCLSWRLWGRLDRERITASIQELVKRHEVLRTTFVADDEGTRQLIGGSPAIELEIIDCETVASPIEAAQAFLRDQSHLRFDYARGPMLRAYLLSLRPEEAILVIVFPHIAVDYWSLSILTSELWSAYAASQVESIAPKPALQYADFAVHERGFFGDEELDLRLAHWRESLSRWSPGALFPMDLTVPFPMRSANALRIGRNAWLDLDDSYDDLMACMTSLRASRQAFFATVYALVLAFYADRDDVLFRLLVHNRRWPALAGVVGPIAKPIAVQVELDPQSSLGQATAAVAKAVVNAYRFDLPVAMLDEVGALGPYVNLSDSSLGAASPPSLPGLRYENFFTTDEVTYDQPFVDFVVGPGRRLGVRLKYDPACFSDARISEMFDHLRFTACFFCEHPELSPVEFRQASDAAGFGGLRIARPSGLDIN